MMPQLLRGEDEPVHAEYNLEEQKIGDRRLDIYTFVPRARTYLLCRIV